MTVNYHDYPNSAFYACAVLYRLVRDEVKLLICMNFTGKFIASETTMNESVYITLSWRIFRIDGKL